MSSKETSEADASELPENLEEMFFHIFITIWCVIRSERVTTITKHLKENKEANDFL